jgi:hypothetical protein
MKKLFLLITAILIVTLTGCSKDAYRWKNTTIHVYPDDQGTIYVKYGNGNFNAEPNGSNYQVNLFVKDGDRYSLLINSRHHRIDLAHFDGQHMKASEEINWKRIDDYTIHARGKLLTGYDFYEIFLTQDKFKD